MNAILAQTRMHEAYELDVNYAINTCRRIALFWGLWPNFEKSVIKKCIKLMINFISFTLMTFVIVSCIMYGTFELKFMSEKVNLTGPTSFFVMAFMKYSIILFRNKDIENCLQFIREDWQCIETAEQREIMLRHAKFGRLITILCASFMYIGGFWYHVLSPLTADAIVTVKNLTVQPFPSPVYGKYFTSGESPFYEIIYAAEIVAGFLMYSVAVVTFSFAAILTIHACGQFEIVIIYLNHLVSGVEKEKSSDVHEKFVIAVNLHLRVLSFVSHLESLFNEICMIEIMGCTLNICLLGYYTITGWKEKELQAVISYTILLASFIFNIFIYCLIGELVTIQARKVGETGYMIDWYLLPKTTSKDLLFFIRFSQFPQKISAGKIFVLSLETFSTVLKSSAAYLNALWKMSQ